MDFLLKNGSGSKECILPCQMEILRYMGAAKSDDPAMITLANEAAETLESIATLRYVWCTAPVKIDGNQIDFGFATVNSAALAKNLGNCNQAVFFAATIGAQVDAYIRRYGKTSPSKALALQAAATEFVEKWCDVTEKEILKDFPGFSFTPRFSPGYGDLPLTFQKDIFRLLDCPRKIGVTLTDALLMAPSKSVTAIAGLTTQATHKSHIKCHYCGKKDCPYREE